MECGTPLTPDQERGLLEKYRPWLRDRARGLLTTNGSRHIEDVAQEGWIAMWRHLPNLYKYETPGDFQLKQAANRKMIDAIDKLAVLENGRRQGRRKPGQPATFTTIWAGNPSVTSVSNPQEEDPIWSIPRCELPEVELAYHRGEIGRALGALTEKQRTYVLLRFWFGFDQPALVEQFGYVPRAVWAQAKKNLQRELDHLRSCTD